METFDVEERWPELFAQLDDVQRDSVRQSLAAGWDEGSNPTREDVENLTDLARGAIDEDEYLRRSRADGSAVAVVMETFDVEERWPELFAQLDDVQVMGRCGTCLVRGPRKRWRTRSTCVRMYARSSSRVVLW